MLCTFEIYFVTQTSCLYFLKNIKHFPLSLSVPILYHGKNREKSNYYFQPLSHIYLVQSPISGLTFTSLLYSFLSLSLVTRGGVCGLVRKRAVIWSPTSQSRLSLSTWVSSYFIKTSEPAHVSVPYHFLLSPRVDVM